MDNKNFRFDSAVSALSDNLAKILLNVPVSAKQSAFEIRLRVGMPIALTCAGQIWFLDNRAGLNNKPNINSYLVTSEDIAESVIKMCSYSVHTHQEELKNGYISLRGGHRAGICGTAVSHKGEITAVRDISSFNLRVARDLEGVATPIIERVFRDGLCGAIIAGPPSSGKTTVLRDVARQLSNGAVGGCVKTVVIDERGELGAVYEGIPQNNLGVCCDILNGYPKGEGIWHAIRTLSPQVIICDEIGGIKETESIIEGLNCGVKIIATAHAGTINELLARPQIKKLLQYGAFKRIVQLEGSQTPGIFSEIIEAGDFLETTGTDSCSNVRNSDGHNFSIDVITEAYADSKPDKNAWHSFR